MHIYCIESWCLSIVLLWPHTSLASSTVPRILMKLWSMMIEFITVIVLLSSIFLFPCGFLNNNLFSMFWNVSIFMVLPSPDTWPIEWNFYILLIWFCHWLDFCPVITGNRLKVSAIMEWYMMTSRGLANIGQVLALDT